MGGHGADSDYLLYAQEPDCFFFPWVRPVKKRKWVVLSLLAACFGLVLAYLCLGTRSSIAPTKYERVQIGMNRNEVQEILGGAIGETDRHIYEVKDGQIWLRFDKTGTVIKKEWNPVPQGFWDRFRQWLRL
jgi:hypothetical protein